MFTSKRLKSKHSTIYSIVKNIRFDKIDGLWVPMEADFETLRTHSIKGDFANTTTKYVRTEIHLNPDFDALRSFKLDEVPNGTRAYVIGERGKVYKWIDGQIVPDGKSQ